MNENPKLSIITINFNNRDGLRRTIESVVNQTTRDFEYIIIDGGSSDGSVDVIKEYEKYIDYWVSEPDKGIYNAMNKGVVVAHGEFCLFLNSGDWLHSNIVIEVILPYLQENLDILVGNTMSKYNNKWIKISPPSHISILQFAKNSLPHQSSFIKTNLMKKFPYNEDLKIVSDWEFFIKSFINEAKFASFPFIIANFDTPGFSANSQAHNDERDLIGKELIYPILCKDLTGFPNEMIEIMNNIPNAVRLQNIICKICRTLVKIYCFIKKKKYINNLNYITFRSIILSKKQKRNFRLLQ